MTSPEPAPAEIGLLTAQAAPAHAAPPAPHARLAPLAPERFALQVTIDQATHDKLRYAQSLLGHAVPSGDMAAVLDRALDALILQLERQKFAKCARSRPGTRRRADDSRYIPAGIRRAVWQRDGGRCTFVSEKGHRCEARSRLEFDHVDAFARGGRATTQGLRLRCRAHNQYEAERTLGAGFMQRKRDEARERATHVREAKQAREDPHAGEVPMVSDHNSVVPWLRQLGFRADEARRGAALCEAIPDAPLEERVRYALKGLAPGSARRSGPAATSPP
jgi:5-methylcytosine-specific restriction endonuclease McrA